MSNAPAPVGQSDAHELAPLQSQWWWFLLLGVGLIVLGTIAITVPFVFTLTSVVVFGVLLLMGGAAQIVSSFWAGRWQGFLLHVLSGVLYLVVGFLMVDDPLKGAAALTMLMAAMFIIGGIFRIIAALQLRFHNWGWPLLHGLVTLFLGVIVWSNLPFSALWLIGLMLGIEMIFNGWAWAMLAFNLRGARSYQY